MTQEQSDEKEILDTSQYMFKTKSKTDSICPLFDNLKNKELKDSTVKGSMEFNRSSISDTISRKKSLASTTDNLVCISTKSPSNKYKLSKKSDIDSSIKKLNKLKEDIASKLNEVKGVLNKYENDKIEQKNSTAQGEPVKFRFIRRVRRRSSLLDDTEKAQTSRFAENSDANVSIYMKDTKNKPTNDYNQLVAVKSISNKNVDNDIKPQISNINILNENDLMINQAQIPIKLSSEIEVINREIKCNDENEICNNENIITKNNSSVSEKTDDKVNSCENIEIANANSNTYKKRQMKNDEITISSNVDKNPMFNKHLKLLSSNKTNIKINDNDVQENRRSSITIMELSSMRNSMNAIEVHKRRLSDSTTVKNDFETPIINHIKENLPSDKFIKNESLSSPSKTMGSPNKTQEGLTNINLSNQIRSSPHFVQDQSFKDRKQNISIDFNESTNVSISADTESKTKHTSFENNPKTNSENDKLQNIAEREVFNNGHEVNSKIVDNETIASPGKITRRKTPKMRRDLSKKSIEEIENVTTSDDILIMNTQPSGNIIDLNEPTSIEIVSNELCKIQEHTVSEAPDLFNVKDPEGDSIKEKVATPGKIIRKKTPKIKRETSKSSIDIPLVDSNDILVGCSTDIIEKNDDTPALLTSKPTTAVICRPKAKKKVVIRKIRRRLSKDDPFSQDSSQDNTPVTEISEKDIFENDEAISDKQKETTPVEDVKITKTILKLREFKEGDIVRYGERFKKTGLKWKRATIIERITSISYKLNINGEEKTVHVGFLKRETNRKVNFGGKEYLEIDYEQIEEDEEAERSYSIWDRS